MAVAEPNALSRRVLESSNRELRLLAARGYLPLPPSELIPLQVGLAREADPEIAGRAAAALRATEPEIVADFLSTEAGEDELSFFAADAQHPKVVEALLRRRDMPHSLLRTMAPRLAVAGQEILILRQDAIVESPDILDALEANNQLDSAVRRRIGEYRQHLLRRKEETVVAPEETDTEASGDAREASDEEVKAAIEEVKKTPSKGDVDDLTGLTEGQIRMLTVSVRRRLTHGASRTLRSVLIRDANPSVAVATLLNNRIGDEEAEQIARNRSVCDEVLQEIGRRREWVSKTAVVQALVSNPRTPVGVSVRLVGRLGMRDLRNLSRNRNIPDAVRSKAGRMYIVKSR